MVPTTSLKTSETGRKPNTAGKDYSTIPSISFG